MEVGQIVRIKVPIEAGTLPLWKYSGTVAEITNKVTHRNYQGRAVHYYELEDCVSDQGKPYGFMEAWLKEE